MIKLEKIWKEVFIISFEVSIPATPGEAGGTTKTPVRISDLRAEIRTRNLTNTKQLITGSQRSVNSSKKGNKLSGIFLNNISTSMDTYENIIRRFQWRGRKRTHFETDNSVARSENEVANSTTILQRRTRRIRALGLLTERDTHRLITYWKDDQVYHVSSFTRRKLDRKIDHCWWQKLWRHYWQENEQHTCLIWTEIYLKKRNDADVKEQYQTQISNLVT